MSSSFNIKQIRDFVKYFTQQIDPLKFRTYGVKRPLDEKEEKIQRLLDENKRYYPTTKNGKTLSHILDIHNNTFYLKICKYGIHECKVKFAFSNNYIF